MQIALVGWSYFIYLWIFLLAKRVIIKTVITRDYKNSYNLDNLLNKLHTTHTTNNTHIIPETALA